MLNHYVAFDTKDDSFLQISSQKQSMSSKYDCILDALIIMLGSGKFEYNSWMTNYVDSWCKIWYQRQSNPPKLQSGTINVLQLWLCSWCTYNDARELEIWIQLRNYNYVDSWWQIWYQRWYNPLKIQSGTINILQVWLYSWCTFNHARELKICIQIKNYKYIKSSTGACRWVDL